MDWKIRSFVIRGIGLLLCVTAGYGLLRYGLPVLLPFGIAYLLSCAVRPVAVFFEKKTGIGKKVWAVVLIVLSCALLGGVLWLLGSVLARELKEIMEKAGKLLSDEESAVRKTSDRMIGMLRNVNMISEEYPINIADGLNTAFQSLTGAVARVFGKMVKGAPDLLFFVVVTVLSLFYFSCDMDRIKAELRRFLPERVCRGASLWLGIGVRSVKRFARAYLSLLAITFTILGVGFLIIGTEYPFLCALLTALVDILPVFGVGTVLVPWAVVLFLTGKTAKAVGMLVLLCVIYATRQILEPKIVGGVAGVHPILALFAVFLGFRLGGVVGMLAAPVALNALTAFWEEKKKKT